MSNASKRKMPLSLIPLAPGIGLYLIALALPAYGPATGTGQETAGWGALLLSVVALLPMAFGVVWAFVRALVGVGIDRSILTMDGAGVVGVTVLSALANPMFVASCIAVAVRRRWVAVATSALAVAGMVSSWYWVTDRYGSLMEPNAPTVAYQPMIGYYIWCAAGVAVFVGACSQLLHARLSHGRVTTHVRSSTET